MSIIEIEKLQEKRQFTAALFAAKKHVKETKSRPALLKLAELSLFCRQYGDAREIYNKVLEADTANNQKPDDALLGVARACAGLGDFKEAIRLLDKAQVAEKFEAQRLACLARSHRGIGDVQRAGEFAEAALKVNAALPEANYEAAQFDLSKKKFDSALQKLERNLEVRNPHGDSIDLWLKTLKDLDRNRYAQNKLAALAKKFPDVLEFVFGLATTAHRAGETAVARPAFEAALKLSPNNSRVLYEFGVCERIAGNLERSQELLGRSLKSTPDNPAALRTYGSDLRYEYGDENFKRLNLAVAKFSDYGPIEQLHLHYALAKAMEDVGELDAAFRHYGVAGAKKRKLETWNERDAVKMSETIPKVVTPARIAAANEKGCDSEVPVFILGMPRSGTSLMEQVLSSHPDIYGAGELKFLPGILENIGLGADKGLRLRLGDREPVFPYDDNASWAARGAKYVEKLQSLAGGNYSRIVDKMPGNFNFVGLINAVLPNAKIIHSRRHPVETCLSCYRIHFAEGHHWTYNLRELGRFYKRYWALMEYWRNAFPGVMFEVRYEDNVADIEGSAKKLIDHLGLEWNDNCLNFYNTDRPVKTASVTQVRKPIYKSSTNRWRKYENYLEPLLEELGDIVPKYEAEIAHLIEK